MNTTTALATNGQKLESVLIQGDLSKLTSEEKAAYYLRVCQSLDLNPLTKPFEYLNLGGKYQLYARKDCAEQLRKKHGVTLKIVEAVRADGVYIVRARATMPDGREDESTGVVSVEGLKGDALANALMKAETKAKRRVTLSICGLGMLDETEIETIPGAQVVPVPQLPAANDAKIGADQLRTLSDKLDEVARAEQWARLDVVVDFLATCQTKRPEVKHLEDVPAHWFDAVVKNLDERIAKAKAVATELRDDAEARADAMSY